jgi:hypothetical protein
MVVDDDWWLDRSSCCMEKRIQTPESENFRQWPQSQFHAKARDSFTFLPNRQWPHPIAALSPKLEKSFDIVPQQPPGLRLHPEVQSCTFISCYTKPLPHSSHEPLLLVYSHALWVDACHAKDTYSVLSSISAVSSGLTEAALDKTSAQV